jgi:hypothetical protein
MNLRYKAVLRSLCHAFVEENIGLLLQHPIDRNYRHYCIVKPEPPTIGLSAISCVMARR